MQTETEPLTELHHETINCKVLLKVIDSFKTLMSNRKDRTLGQQELPFGTLANSNVIRNSSEIS